MIDYAEEDALKRILRHHDVTVTPKLVADVSVLLEWVRADEAVKARFDNKTPPPFLISLLSTMGIFGADYLSQVPVESP